jgi:hypothetical protein
MYITSLTFKKLFGKGHLCLLLKDDQITQLNAASHKIAIGKTSSPCMWLLAKLIGRSSSINSVHQVHSRSGQI